MSGAKPLKGGPMVNHYGVHVNQEEATTGVFQLNGLEFIWEDVELAGIDLAWEDHKKECEDYIRDEECNCDIESCDHLIGYRKDEKSGLFEPDEKAEYSALVRGDSNVIQVVRSIWGIRCALCSPCYPGQGDGDNSGEFLAFAIPPDVVGNYGNQELKKRIFLLEEGK
jgi:hypothetical protein